MSITCQNPDCLEYEHPNPSPVPECTCTFCDGCGFWYEEDPCQIH